MKQLPHYTFEIDFQSYCSVLMPHYMAKKGVKVSNQWLLVFKYTFYLLIKHVNKSLTPHYDYQDKKTTLLCYIYILYHIKTLTMF